MLNQSINEAVLNHPVYQKLFWDENTSLPMWEKSLCFLLRMNQTAQVTFSFESLNLSPRFVPCHYQLGIIYTCCATHLLILRCCFRLCCSFDSFLLLVVHSHTGTSPAYTCKLCWLIIPQRSCYWFMSSCFGWFKKSSFMKEWGVDTKPEKRVYSQKICWSSAEGGLFLSLRFSYRCLNVIIL